MHVISYQIGGVERDKGVFPFLLDMAGVIIPSLHILHETPVDISLEIISLYTQLQLSSMISCETQTRHMVVAHAAPST